QLHAVGHGPGHRVTPLYGALLGLGAVPLPIRAPQAKKLISVARPAHFGKGEETVLDTDVRDTWEVPAERVRLGGPSWDAERAEALERMGETLGLPHGARLRPEF